MSPYHITLADDHVLMRQGLRRIIEEAPDLKIVGEAGDGEELLRLLGGITPHLVVLDISMPNLRGLDAVREIKARYPKVKVLMLTMHRDKEYLYQALESGADGYLLKEDADTELLFAIHKILQGGFHVSAVLSEELAEYQKLPGCGTAGSSFEGECLTTREKEVLKLLGEGKSCRETADILCISARTVDHHRANIMDKLKLRKTADLVRYALSKGYAGL
jgi:DNA-binding NarL/FixJ family response regulator